MAKIVGEDLKPYVINQIKVRQGNNGHGSGVNDARTDSTIKYLNSKTAFVKLASGVYMEKDRISDEELKGGNLNFSLAKNYVLSGGVTRYDSKTDNWEQRSRGAEIKDEFSGAYGVNPSSNPKLSTINNPMPGIESVKIRSLNRGSITKAQVQIKCYSPEQFQLIELLYMRLGYTVLLEWGNSQYLNNNGGLEHMGYTLIEDTSDNGFFTFFKKDLNAYYNIIEGFRKDKYGNYDAILAKIVNFHWDFDPKTSSYNIQLDLISQGDIIESFKINTYPDKYTTEELTKDPDNKDNKEIQNPKDKLSYFLHLQKYLKRKIQESKDISISIGNNSPSEYVGMFLNPTLYPDLNAYNIQNSQNPNDVIHINTQTYVKGEDQPKIDNMGFYIRFQYLLEFINNYVLPIDKEFKKRIFSIDTDLYTPMYRAPLQVSFDPRICIVNNSLEKLNTKEYYPEIEPWAQKTPPLFIPDVVGPVFPKPSTPLIPKGIYVPDNIHTYMNDAGWTMNLYLNFDNIQKHIDNNLDKKGKLSIYNFLSGLCDDINAAMGGVNNLEPIVEDNIIYIIDSSFTNYSSENYKNKILLYGYGENNIDSTFVRDFNLKTEITPELATMITIGATSDGYVKGTENTMFSKWNKGIIDRFKSSYVNYDGSDVEEKPEDVVREYVEKIFDKPGYEPFGYNIELIDRGQGSYGSAFKLFLTLDDDIISQNVSIATEFYKYLQTHLTSKDPKYSSPINGFIPINLSLTMDGFSGIKIYNSIDVDTRFLPKNYGDNLSFIIKGVNHTLSNQDWETNIETVVCSKSEESLGKKYPYSTIYKNTFDYIKTFSNTLSSNKSSYYSNKKPVYYDVDYTAVGKLNPNLIKQQMIANKLTPAVKRKGQILIQYFQNKLGLTQEQSAGLVANLIAESGLNSNRIEGVGIKIGTLSTSGDAGYGYSQWTSLSRKIKLRKFIQTKTPSYDGSQPLTDEQNKEFVVHELKTSYPDILVKVKGSNVLYPIQDATLEFLQSYENPAFVNQEPPEASKRIGFAFQLLDQIPQ